jgi:competence protein ComEC
VLKVPHHGSAYSDPGFLAAVHARVAVISVGAGNDYGQPSPHLLSILDRLSVPAYRTDLDGDVAVCATAAGLSVVEHGRAATTAG